MQIQKILIVDDHDDFRNSLKELLEDEFLKQGEKLEIMGAKTEGFAKLLLKDNPDIKVTLLDYVMEYDNSGQRIFNFIKEEIKHKTRVIYLTGAVRETDQKIIEKRDNVDDYINKNPLDIDKIATSINRRLTTYEELERCEIKANAVLKEVEVLKTVVRKEIEEKMGKGKVISKIFDQIEKHAKTDAHILLEGETGTGKELIANYLWKNSLKKEMKTLNCGSLSSELADSELFGHKKGSFTGAVSDEIGIIKATDGGILFLDEINSLPLEVQVKLLRVMEYGTFIRKGYTEETKVNIRIIAAGNKSFQELIDIGKFRDDLYERFTKKITIPTLKERIEDIDHFIDTFLSNESNKQSKKVFISDDARKLLSVTEWERNVRQLKNTIANLVTEVEIDKKSETYIIKLELLKECLQDNRKRKNDVPDNDYTWETAQNIAMKKAIERAMKKGETHVKAIELLGIAKNTYNDWRKKLGMMCNGTNF